MTSDPTLEVGLTIGLADQIATTTNVTSNSNIILIVGESKGSVSSDIQSLSFVFGGVEDTSGTTTKNIANADQYVATSNVSFAGWMPSTNVGTVVELLADASDIVTTGSAKMAIMASGLITVGTGTVNETGTFEILSTQQLNEGIQTLILTVTNINGTATGSMRIVVDYSAPLITLFTIDGQTKVSGDVIAAQPVISVTLTDNYSLVSTSSLTVLVDDGLASMVSYNWTTNGAGMAFSGGVFTFTLPTALSSSITHNLTFLVSDTASTANVSIIQLDNLRVVAGSATLVQGPAFNPNPFNPMSNNSDYRTTRIAYELSQGMDLQINIYNMRGEPVWKRSYTADAAGAMSGYNEVSWNGINDYGELCGNGVYIVQLVSGSKLLAKGKVAILK